MVLPVTEFRPCAHMASSDRIRGIGGVKGGGGSSGGKMCVGICIF
jgi:hypothetical protein